MSKETEIKLSVTVKDGPKTEPQTTKLPKEYCGTNVRKAINEELVISESNCSEDHAIMFNLAENESLAFVTIHADRYVYKDACGNEQPGIWYFAEDCEDMPFEFLDGPHVYVSRWLQTLDFEKLQFKVCDEMLSCLSDADKKKGIVINVTYGVGVFNTKACPDCSGCGTPSSKAGAKAKNQRRELEMSV